MHTKQPHYIINPINKLNENDMLCYQLVTWPDGLTEKELNLNLRSEVANWLPARMARAEKKHW